MSTPTILNPTNRAVYHKDFFSFMKLNERDQHDQRDLVLIEKANWNNGRTFWFPAIDILSSDVIYFFLCFLRMIALFRWIAKQPDAAQSLLCAIECRFPVL